jgi:hypothetical protein
MDDDLNRRLLALFVAGHAVVETRVGAVYEHVTLLESPGWAEPPRPLAWRSQDEASALLTRLSAGCGALLRHGSASEHDAARLAKRDLEGLADLIERLEGTRPSIQQALTRAQEVSSAFFHDDANSRALGLVQKELLELGSLTMHEIDFLVEAADGSDEALDDLARFRATFSPTRIPWPDHT